LSRISPQRIFGIDPGSRLCGFACLEAKKSVPLTPQDFQLVGMGVIRLDIKESHDRRIGELHKSMITLLQEFKPQICVLEKAFFGENANSALKLGEARGAIIAALHLGDVHLEQVAPTQVKKSVFGSGRASKEEVALVLKTLFAIDSNQLPFDATDALALALHYGISFRGTVPPPRRHPRSNSEPLL
jgi:crossover junction endodeoxyribonuclease RuvC